MDDTPVNPQKPSISIPSGFVAVEAQSQTTVSNPASVALAAVEGKRRGRHPKECTCPKCTNRKSQVGIGNTPNSQSTLTEAEKKLARETVIALTHTADTFALIAIRRKIGWLNVTAQRDVLERVPMTESLRNGIAESGALVAEKHGIAGKMPEFALGAYLSAYMAGIAMLIKDINELRAEYIQHERDTKIDNGPERKRENKLPA